MGALRLPVIVLLVLCTGIACERPNDTTAVPSQSASQSVPQDLQRAIEQLSQGLEAFDAEQVLAVYAEDFTSGTGRSKQGVGEVLERLQKSNVSLSVDKVEVKEANDTQAEITTYMRLRYIDRFRNIGEGEVVITDVLSHLLRKDDGQWGIYADRRLEAYREGRFGERSPNVTVEVPDQLPTGLEYPVSVIVQPQKKTYYRVSLGNYPEDPGALPPPDVVTMIPEDGRLDAKLLPNPRGLSEMVRVTVIAEDFKGDWQGATTISKLVPGIQRTERRKKRKQPQPAPEQHEV